MFSIKFEFKITPGGRGPQNKRCIFYLWTKGENDDDPLNHEQNFFQNLAAKQS